MTCECANSFEQLYLYEPDDDDSLWSAVFMRPNQYYVEVRVVHTRAWVLQATEVGYWGGRVSCMNRGEILLESSFENEDDGKKYFWSFVNNPELGVMEASL